MKKEETNANVNTTGNKSDFFFEFILCSVNQHLPLCDSYGACIKGIRRSDFQLEKETNNNQIPYKNRAPEIKNGIVKDCLFIMNNSASNLRPIWDKI